MWKICRCILFIFLLQDLQRGKNSIFLFTFEKLSYSNFNFAIKLIIASAFGLMRWSLRNKPIWQYQNLQKWFSLKISCLFDTTTEYSRLFILQEDLILWFNCFESKPNFYHSFIIICEIFASHDFMQILIPCT